MSSPWNWDRDVLATRAAATPQRTAAVDTVRSQEWTFGALDAIVDDVATQLQTVDDVATQLETPVDDSKSPRVACLLSTRLAFAATLHATHRIGGTLVPLSTDIAPATLRERYDRTEPDCLVCEAGTEERAVDVASCPVVSADSPQREGVGALLPPAGSDATSPERQPAEPADTAVILFTSGTTGEPKGVRLTHRNLTASAVASAFRLGVSPGDRWLCCLAPSHMGGLAPFYRTALYGTAVALQPSFNSERTAAALANFGVTGVSLVPTQLRRLLDAGWTPASSLQTVLLGGAPASAALVERALEAGVPLHPTYGLTETASQVATARPADLEENPETVGQPLFGTRVTIRNDGEMSDRQPGDGRIDDKRDDGELGEIIVDGPTVTPGYLDAGRTDAAFCEDGLRTGDLGQRDGDGRLTVVGRRDGMIQTGGKLVAPAEVADRLTTHGAVEDAAVVGVPDDEWGERVVALVVADDSAVTAEELIVFCKAALAGYKCPKTVEFIADLPRTASGTVDREAARERF